MTAGAGTAAIQVALDVGLIERHARWATVNHAADGRAVGFTEVGDCEKGAEGVAAHCSIIPLSRSRPGRGAGTSADPPAANAANNHIAPVTLSLRTQAGHQNTD